MEPTLAIGDCIDSTQKVTLRHGAGLHHIGVGHPHKGKRVILVVDGLDVRVISVAPSPTAGSNA